MKKIFAVVAVFLVAFSVWGKSVINETVSDDGKHSYTERIGTLAKNGVKDEIVLVNSSSRTLGNVTCTLFLGGKSHTLRSIPSIAPGETRDFGGIYDDDLDEELYGAFGRAGRFASSNKSELSFALSFGAENNAVRVARVYQHKDNLCFEIVDSASASSSSHPSSAASGSSEPQKVVIDGQSYILVDGQAYKVNE